MITVRNKDHALPITVKTATANMVPGQIVKITAGAAAGEVPTATAITAAADLSDVTLLRGIIDFIQPDSQYVDFVLSGNVLTTLTTVSDAIPLGSLAVVWTGSPVLGYYSNKFDAGVTYANLREPTAVAFKVAGGGTGLVAVYASGASNGEAVVKGNVLRVDGPEATIAFKNL